MNAKQVLHVRMAPRVLTLLVDINVIVQVDTKDNIVIKVRLLFLCSFVIYICQLLKRMAGLQCHAIKNKNHNHSMNYARNLGCDR